jgi:outer membrane protein OmpA-like peptidoglycan-associated protein
MSATYRPGAGLSGVKKMRGPLLVLIACTMALPIAAMADPAPQYTPQQLEQRLGIAAPSANAAGCASQDPAKPPDPACDPDAPSARSFSLEPPVGPHPARRPPGYIQPGHATPSAHASVDLLITFANSSAVLTDQARANAAVFADVMRTDAPTAHFAIDGHTSAVGSRAYNLRLSRDRAQALTNYLVSLGIDGSRFEVKGYGFDRPIDPRHPAAPVNRRVEARLLASTPTRHPARPS